LERACWDRHAREGHDFSRAVKALSELTALQRSAPGDEKGCSKRQSNLPQLPCDIQPCSPPSKGAILTKTTVCAKLDRFAAKPFIIKIFAFKLFDIRILQTSFAEPAPPRFPEDVGGGGVPRFKVVLAIPTRFEEIATNFIFRRNPQSDSAPVGFAPKQISSLAAQNCGKMCSLRLGSLWGFVCPTGRPACCSSSVVLF
jgi:hypothetical protein